MEGGEPNRKLVRERPAQERERVFVYVRGCQRNNGSARVQ